MTPTTPSPSMPLPIVRCERDPMPQTNVWPQEFEWLHSLLRSSRNTSPKFRVPDLLSACVTLVLGAPGSEAALVHFLRTELAFRAPASGMRGCCLWAPQWNTLYATRKAAWNSYPHPMFELEHIATACVAIASRSPFGADAVLAAAKANMGQRESTATRHSNG